MQISALLRPVSEVLTEVSALLDAHDYRGAVELFSSMRPSDREVSALLECARALQRPAKVARPKLEALQQRTTEDVRDLVAACAPADWHQHRPASVFDAQDGGNRVPRWRAANRHEAPRDFTTGRTLRRLAADRAEISRAKRAHHLMEKYAATRLGVDDDAPAESAQVDTAPARLDSPTVYASGLDYDDAAKHPARGRCVSCNVEPSEIDRRKRDGLCEECRDRGRPGLQVLPVDASRADRIRAVCAYRYAHAPHPVAALRTEWARYSRSEDQLIVEDWVSRNVPAAERRAAAEPVTLPTPRTAADDAAPVRAAA